MGAEVARRGLRLVYGGGGIGLMGAMADAALAEGGEVVGVIPKALFQREAAHGGITELHVVGSMHERKRLMADLSDAFVTLPGGFGTLEEFSEVLSWAQLAIHAKPCALLDVEGYWRPLLGALDCAVAEGFTSPGHRGLVLEASSPSALLDTLARYSPEAGRGWLGPEEL